MDRFITPDEAGSLTTDEQERFKTLQAEINQELRENFVAGHNCSVTLAKITPRVFQKLKSGLEAAGWQTKIDTQSGVFTIFAGKIPGAAPVIIDRRSK